MLGVTAAYLVHGLCVAVEIRHVLVQHLQRSTEGAPCFSVHAVRVAGGDDVWTSFVDGCEAVRSIVWSFDGI